MHIWRLTVKRCELIRAYYNIHEEIDDRMWHKVDLIHTANTLEEAERLAKKAEDSYFFHCTSIAPARGIQGIKKTINSRKGLIKQLTANGSETALKKAEEYRKQIEDLELQLQQGVQLPTAPWLTPEWNKL